MESKKYNYKTVTYYNDSNNSNLIQSLNDLGNEGYRVIDVFKQNNSIRYLFEKEFEDNFSNVSINNYKKSLWHGSDEAPICNIYVKCLVELDGDYYDGRNFKVYDYHKGIGFSTPNGWLNLNKVIAWAYMKDIVPVAED
jgi:hypothetical protein